uniref:Reverse transcriptase zinc-binding domain-containing protein n=1 Tax=Lactuca sativa TaxID=4236 RepID=A0A9R1XEM0_LACSA|nr:hypothetical protein LSAT_V11C400220670 [Lactuca sativa]
MSNFCGEKQVTKNKWVSWEKIISPKDLGGLEVGSLRSFNISLIMKWWWRYRSEPNSIWNQIIQGIHDLKHKKTDCIAKKSIIGEWKSYPNNEDQVNELDVITSWIGTFQPNNRSDNWVCTISRDGVEVEDFNYGHCPDVEETPSHILVSCPYAKLVWDWITKWCKVPTVIM